MTVYPKSHLLEGIFWDRVQSHDWLVGLLDNDVFAFIQLEAQVNDCSDNAPAVLHVQIDLHGKVFRLADLHTIKHKILHKIIEQKMICLSTRY